MKYFYPEYQIFNEGQNDEAVQYKQSNDSQLYTELASPGIEITDMGFLVFFVGEMEPLNNENTYEDVLNNPRNIGVLLVNHDLDKSLTG